MRDAAERKRVLYKEMQTVLDSLPRYDTNIILGDFNVRLMERLDRREQGILGSHIVRNGED